MVKKCIKFKYSHKYGNNNFDYYNVFSSFLKILHEDNFRSSFSNLLFYS